MTPKKSKKYLVAIIIAIMAILVIGGYSYYGGEATLADFSYKESVYGITIGKIMSLCLKKPQMTKIAKTCYGVGYHRRQVRDRFVS